MTLIGDWENQAKDIKKKIKDLSDDVDKNESRELYYMRKQLINIQKYLNTKIGDLRDSLHKKMEYLN